MGVVWTKIVLLQVKISASPANKGSNQMKMEFADSLIPTVLHLLTEDASLVHLAFMLIKQANVNHYHKTVSLQT